MVRYFICLLLFSSALIAKSQQPLLTLNENYYHLVDRYAILSDDSLNLCTSIKPFNRKHIPQIIGGNTQSRYFSSSDGFNFNVLENDNWNILPTENAAMLHINRSKWKQFYQYKGSFFSVNSDDLKLIVNPALAFAVSNDGWRNTRGLELRGSIGEKVGFYSFISENQIQFPEYMVDEIQHLGVIRGTGFIKRLYGANRPQNYLECFCVRRSVSERQNSCASKRATSASWTVVERTFWWSLFLADVLATFFTVSF